MDFLELEVVEMEQIKLARNQKGQRQGVHETFERSPIRTLLYHILLLSHHITPTITSDFLFNISNRANGIGFKLVFTSITSNFYFTQKMEVFLPAIISNRVEIVSILSNLRFVIRNISFPWFPHLLRFDLLLNVLLVRYWTKKKSKHKHWNQFHRDCVSFRHTIAVLSFVCGVQTWHGQYLQLICENKQ